MNGPIAQGTIYFSQASETDPVSVTGSITNVDPNSDRGFHVHTYGDTSDACMAAGEHFNPEGVTHGAPYDLIRHVGDLGNVHSDENGVVSLNIVDNRISLNGANSIIGRSIVIHAGTDDLGRGGTPASLTSGNSGSRAGCAVIGK
ncbi:hypothetical protein M422DRAFT_57711 [Sphaerobolus stellatus SS14]|uniref:Superoxide dismutase [Cu-Zn] n=1 Tax=Sphaerobolus stellatus (strain SS14) TaxID=990650 RepID=A0A0C9TWU4_SPHS4|nr:hypothetical protein M422DRAFT_61352 [Sphaerobolus stellatus SS14]KIJ56425.1 hypothetical protein M422DRAFT_57711 [Sphaerobolus stellatus SS14]